ncbi:MAG: GAF domain-containing sensor histidine kinase [Chloroflexi bacterium]|nr:GAF domain-containing sensor histidine kinase [Chloroflexota bacterium]
MSKRSKEPELDTTTAEVAQRLAALSDVASTVSRSLDLDLTLNTALDKVMALVRAEVGGILLYHERTHTLYHRTHRGMSDKFVKRIGKLKLGEGIPGMAAELRETIYSPDIEKDTKMSQSLPELREFSAFLSIPLVARDRLLGVLNVATRDKRGFSPEAISLVTSVSDQIAVAIENAQLYEALQRKEQARGELLRKIMSVQEEERKRIARELHDEVSQSLTGSAFRAEAVLSRLPVGAEEIRGSMEEIRDLAIRTLDEIHRVVYSLRPSLLDDLGLVAAVQWLADHYLEESGIKVLFETVGSERPLSAEAEITLFRITQEAITNIVKHAGAESVSIAVEFRDHSAAVHIEDDGQGFSVEDMTGSLQMDRGLGLLGMKERAELLDGYLGIEALPGQGTKVYAEVPA